MPGNNASGKNQHKNCPASDDPRLIELLTEYHRRGNSVDVIRDLLLMEHGITVSSARELFRGVKTSWDCEAGRQGPRTIVEAIRLKKGIHLTRDSVTEDMRTQDPDGFARRRPTAKQVHRSALVSIGPHHEWSADGDDKLTAFGFPIWGVRDKWSGKWLGLWVVPNNRLKLAVAYMYLSLVHELGGMPIQSTTDCGSKTALMYALTNALRNVFTDIAIDEADSHVFLRSIHNISIERGWFRLRTQWGDNIKVVYESGAHVYNAADPREFELHEWLWPKFIQQELDKLRDQFNNHTTRFDKNKVLPSGIAPNIAYSLCGRYGGENCLQEVDRGVVRCLMDEIGSGCVQFVTPEYAAKAEASFAELGIPEVTKHNIWDVFTLMKQHMY